MYDGLPFEINEFLFSFISPFLKKKIDTKTAVISEKVVNEVTGKIRVRTNGGRPSEQVRFFSWICKPSQSFEIKCSLQFF